MGCDVPEPIVLEVPIEEEWGAVWGGGRLVLDAFWGCHPRSEVAGKLRHRGVPDNIARAVSKSIAPEVWDGQTGRVVSIALGTFYDRAAGW